MEEGLNHFLNNWFAGYMDGLLSLDGEQQDIFFSACGKACADSYTAERFREAWKSANGDLPQFLEHLGHIFPESEYSLIENNKIEVKYNHCACDLVEKGWVDNPMQCLCSLHNLKVNFEVAMEREIKVELKESILAGSEQCCFLVSWSLLGC